MIRIQMHDPGIVASDWTQYQLLQTKLVSKHCLDPHGRPQDIRAIKCHSGTPKIHPNIFTLLEIPHAWKVRIYHTESSNSDRSIVEGRIIAEAPVIAKDMPLLSYGSIGGVIA